MPQSENYVKYTIIGENQGLYHLAAANGPHKGKAIYVDLPAEMLE